MTADHEQEATSGEPAPPAVLASAGPTTDAAALADAGLPGDAGALADAGPTSDAGALADADPTSDPGSLQQVERSYVQVIRARTLLAWLPPLAVAIFLDRAMLDGHALQGLPLVGVPLLAAMTIVTAPPRIWQRLAWALEPAMLRVVRGWWWHVDTLVPLVRVEHLDIARGPFDKMFGTATLVVHTAGTHNSTVSLPGLSPERAAELAAVIRGHIQADLD